MLVEGYIPKPESSTSAGKGELFADPNASFTLLYPRWKPNLKQRHGLEPLFNRQLRHYQLLGYILWVLNTMTITVVDTSSNQWGSFSPKMACRCGIPGGESEQCAFIPPPRDFLASCHGLCLITWCNWPSPSKDRSWTVTVRQDMRQLSRLLSPSQFDTI